MGAMVISTAARGSDVRSGSAAARAREAWFAAQDVQDLPAAPVPTPRRARPLPPTHGGARPRSAAAPVRGAAARSQARAHRTDAEVRQAPVRAGVVAPSRPATGSLRRPVPAAHRSTVVPADERPLRLTRRGRLVVLLLAALVLVAGVQGGQALADGPSRALEVTTYTVAAGETLWEIAAESAGPGEDVRDVVLELQSLNGLATAGLDAGQELVLPVRR
jgi:nucleoid-associated protein YgaU